MAFIGFNKFNVRLVTSGMRYANLNLGLTESGHNLASQSVCEIALHNQSHKHNMHMNRPDAVFSSSVATTLKHQRQRSQHLRWMVITQISRAPIGEGFSSALVFDDSASRRR